MHRLQRLIAPLCRLQRPKGASSSGWGANRQIYIDAPVRPTDAWVAGGAPFTSGLTITSNPHRVMVLYGWRRSTRLPTVSTNHSSVVDTAWMPPKASRR